MIRRGEKRRDREGMSKDIECSCGSRGTGG